MNSQINIHQFYTNVKKSAVIFTGDFNIDLLKIKDNYVISEYFDMLTSQFLS